MSIPDSSREGNMKKKLNILMVFDIQITRPRGYDYKEEFKLEECRVYNEVHRALQKNGHNVRLLGLHNNIRPLLDEIEENRPDVVFNLADIFDEKTHLDKNIAWILEMFDLAYTGGTPANLSVCNDKALSKKILSFHRIKVPHFHTFYRGYRIHRSKKKLKLPLIVKPLSEEASRGISQASLIEDDKALQERIRFIHENMGVDAIAEEYISGREFYASLIGNKSIKALPLREIRFGQIPEEESRIATYKAKWDEEYRKRWGIKNTFAGRLPEKWEEKIVDTCKRAYRALNLRSYVRFDVRVTPDGQVYVIEANVNPSLEPDDEFERSADKAGISFDKLVQRIVDISLQKGK